MIRFYLSYSIQSPGIRLVYKIDLMFFEELVIQGKSCAPLGRDGWKLMCSSGFTTG
jgi:hypothetical protein